MSRRCILVTLLVAAAGCGGSPLGGGQLDATTSGGAQCRHAAGIGDGTPGACGAGRAVVDCEFPNGAGCDCVTDGTTCEGCETGTTCTNKCNTNEYAASCGGIGPGNPSIPYAGPPAACRLVLPTPGGIVFYCCPCL